MIHQQTPLTTQTKKQVTFCHLTLNTVEFVQSDTWVFRHPTKIYGPKVFLLSKINLSIPTSCTICNNFVCLLAYYWMENRKSLQHFYQTLFWRKLFPFDLEYFIKMFVSVTSSGAGTAYPSGALWLLPRVLVGCLLLDL